MVVELSAFIIVVDILLFDIVFVVSTGERRHGGGQLRGLHPLVEMPEGELGIQHLFSPVFRHRQGGYRRRRCPAGREFCEAAEDPAGVRRFGRRLRDERQELGGPGLRPEDPHISGKEVQGPREAETELSSEEVLHQVWLRFCRPIENKMDVAI